MHDVSHFVGGDAGPWRVTAMATLRGEALPQVAAVAVATRQEPARGASPGWTLTGRISHLRYALRAEVTALRAKQEPLGRPSARSAALIPIRKSAAWWELAQDERRAIFEDESQHTRIGLDYLPAVARQLYHCRELGQPFDFLTWFEFAPDAAPAFDDLVARLRASREWSYVEREVDIRLERAE